MDTPKGGSCLLCGHRFKVGDKVIALKAVTGRLTRVHHTQIAHFQCWTAAKTKTPDV